MTRFNQAAIITIIGLAMNTLSCVSRAETMLTTAKPTGTISVAEARKIMRKGDVVFYCSQAVLSDAGGPKKKPGSKSFWTNSTVKDDDGAQDALDDGKLVYKCESKTWDPDRKKIVNAR